MNLSRRNLLGLALTLPAARALASASWSRALVMGTGRVGGDYSLYGPVWGGLAQAATGLDIAFLASGGAVANILLIEQNTAQLGMTTLPVALAARAGAASWTGGVKLQGFRALFPMYPSILQIISPIGTGLATLAQLAGKTIGCGPAGGTGASAMPAVFAALGITPGRIIAGDYAPQMQALHRGELAACAFIGAPPVPAITSMAMGQKFALIGFSAAQCAQVAASLPGLRAMVLPAGLFPGQRVAVASIGTENFAIAAASLPAPLAGAITLAALHGGTSLARLVPAAAQKPDIRPILAGGIPFHPGAVQALRSVGVRVPRQAA